jgi:DNA-directed RNA polymerase II subunit RPB1
MSKENKTNKHSVKYGDDKIIKTTLRTAMYEILSPKKCIIEYEFSKKSFDNVITSIIDSFNKNIIEPGTMVGLIAAQSMGECLTQMTLNTFHTTGISAIVTTSSGIPRIIELISLSKIIKTPQMILYLEKEHMENKKMSNKIASYINHVTIGSMKSSMKIIYDPNPLKENGYRKKDNIMDNFYSQSKNGCQVDFENLPWLFRIVMDKEKMLEREATLLDIKSNFCNSWEKWNNDPKLLKKEEKNIIEKVTQCSISSNNDNDDELIIHIRIDMMNVSVNNLNAFYDIIIDKFKLKGIANVNEGVVNEERNLVFNGEDEAEEIKTQYAIYTNGVNLNDIRYIAGIDLNKTVCNDVTHIYKLYGIEAARSALIREFTSAYERSGNTINAQHISLLADVMSSNGFLVSIDRHGMTKSSNGPLSKASFENTMDHFITAAVFNETDNMKGISARIMAGMAFEGGTGLCKISLDTDMLEKSEFTDDISQKYIKTYNNINSSTEIQDIINKDDDDMFMPM